MAEHKYKYTGPFDLDAEGYVLLDFSSKDDDDCVIPQIGVLIAMDLCKTPGYVGLDGNEVRVPKKIVKYINILKERKLIDLPVPAEQALMRVAWNNRNGAAVLYHQLMWHLSFGKDRLEPPPKELSLKFID